MYFSTRHCRLQCKIWDSLTDHQVKCMSVCRAVYLAFISVNVFRSVGISVLLIIIMIIAQHGCQGPIVSFYLYICLCVICRGEKISNLE